MEADPNVISELVDRIVQTVQPVKIILFGSAVRGDFVQNSDLDVMVVMPDGIHRNRTADRIHRGLWGLGFAKDIIVQTESDLREHADNPYLVIRNALKEGKELYHAAR